jgi:cell filamentation protein
MICGIGTNITCIKASDRTFLGANGQRSSGGGAPVTNLAVSDSHSWDRCYASLALDGLMVCVRGYALHAQVRRGLLSTDQAIQSAIAQFSRDEDTQAVGAARPDSGDPSNELTFSDRALTQMVIRLETLQREPLPGAFDMRHLHVIHKAIFCDVAPESAGRVVSLARFKQLTDAGHRISERIMAADMFKDLSKPEWARAIAKTYADISQLQPFAFGNALTYREFIRVLGLEGGYEIDYTKVDIPTWNESSIERQRGNLAPMANIFSSISDR